MPSGRLGKVYEIANKNGLGRCVLIYMVKKRKDLEEDQVMRTTQPDNTFWWVMGGIFIVAIFFVIMNSGSKQPECPSIDIQNPYPNPTTSEGVSSCQ